MSIIKFQDSLSGYINWFLCRQQPEDIKNKRWADISEDEEVIDFFHPSIWTIVPRLLGGLALIIGSVVGAIYFHPVVLVGILFGIGMILKAHLDRIQTYYVIAEETIIHKTGIRPQSWFGTQFSDDPHPIKNITKTNTNYEGALYEFLGIGTIEISSDATAGIEQKWEFVPDAEKAESEIFEIIKNPKEKEETPSQ